MLTLFSAGEHKVNSEHRVVFCVRQGEREVQKRAAAEDSKNNTVEYCKEILDTIRELKSFDFCHHFLWVWVLKEATLTGHSFFPITSNPKPVLCRVEVTISPGLE